MLDIKRLAFYFLSIPFLLSCSASSQTQNVNSASQSAVTVIQAARMLDVSSGQLVGNPVIVVSGEKIISVGTKADIPAGAKIIDLGDVTLLPGLIDAHTHITYH